MKKQYIILIGAAALVLIYFITAIGISVIILTIIFFVTRKSALEKCADVGFIYIWGEQNKAYISKTFIYFSKVEIVTKGD